MTAGGAAVVFTATLSGASDTIEWALTGPGSIDPTNGSTTTYTPPATVTAVTTATLRATTAALSEQVGIAITGAYGISGAVSGAVVSGVTVQLSGASSATTTTEPSGHYAFRGLPSGSYTVTPSLAGGYVFVPAATDVTLAGGSATGKDFVVVGAHLISGVITGPEVAGIAVTLSKSGTTVATTTTDASGRYVFSGLTNGAYRVTPSLAGGYVISPASLAVTLSGQSAIGQDFVVSGAYSIAGTLSGLAVAGVTVALSGSSSATATTDAGGHYVFTGLAEGRYTVTPSTAGGYAFTPATRTVTLSSASARGQDFASAGANSISGTITGQVVAGVTVSLSRAGTVVSTVVTNDSGLYGFTGLPDGSYTVTPSLAGGFAFTPATRNVTLSSSPAMGQGFVVAGAYSISGTVAGRALAGITVTLSGSAASTTTTDPSGSFSFTGLPDGSYTVTPSLAGGFAFTPAARNVTLSSASAMGLTFASAGAYSVSGAIAGQVVSGVTVTLSLGAATVATTTTLASGQYTFTALTNGGYTVTPSPAGGYVFTPSSAAATVNGASVSGKNFAVAGAYDISGTVSGPSVANLSVRLGGRTGSGTSSTLWAFTDASGHYAFTGLPNGLYFLEVYNPPAGVAFTPADPSIVLDGASRVQNFTGEAFLLEMYTVGSSPVSITSGPDGALWVTRKNGLSRVTTGGAVTEFGFDGAVTPFRIAAGQDSVWFTEGTRAFIGRFHVTSRTLTEYPIPSGNGSYAIAADASGNIWFTEIDLETGSIGRFGFVSQGTSGAVTEYALSTTYDLLYDITAGPDGNIWMADHTRGVQRCSTAGVCTVLMPPNSVVPYDITVGPDSALWFDDGKTVIGRVTTDGHFTSFSHDMYSPTDLAAGADGALWFSEGLGLCRMTTGGVLTRFIFTGLSGATSLARGPDNNIWFVLSGANLVGHL